VGVAVLAIFFVGRLTVTSQPATPGGSAAAAATVWTCSMHPNIKLPTPGQCPICFMDLIPLTTDDQGAGATLSLSDRARQLARIETTEVTPRELVVDLRLSGKIAADETRITYISSYVPGRLDRLFVDFTGILVRKGDHLAEIYSPGLLVSQRELVLALDRLERANTTEPRNETAIQTAQSIVDAAKRKLELAGVPKDEIDRLAREKNPSENVRIDAPSHGWVLERQGYAGMYVETGTRLFTVVDLQRVWAQFEAYELDMPALRVGQTVGFTAEAEPGRTFEGRVAHIDPTLNDRTRSVKVRVNVENADLRLRPGMFVRGVVRVRLGAEGKVLGNELAGKWVCPMHPEVVRDSNVKCDQCGMDLVPAEELGYADKTPPGEKTLAVPTSAVLLTGQRAVVYVEANQDGKPVYEGRVVALGPRAGDWYVVLAGLKEGERVVTRGALAIDSALQIQARPSMMSHDTTETPTASSNPVIASRAVAGAAYHAQVRPIIDACLNLSAALAANKLDDARREAAAMARSARAADGLGLSGDDVKLFAERVKAIADAIPANASTASLDELRKALPAVTTAVETYLRTFGHDHKSPVFRAYCPMAFQNKGAAWLQAGETIENAYFADKMLRCGEIQARIGPDGREAD